MMLIAATARRSLVAPSPWKGEGWDGGGVLASRSCPMCPRLRDSSHILVNSSWVLAGCGPAAGYFLCLAKESNQRKATPVPLPLRGPQKRDRQSGKRINSPYGLKHMRFFIRSDDPFFGSVTGENATANATAKDKTPNPRTKSKSAKPLSEVHCCESGSA
jgi:hypothetical protein